MPDFDAQRFALGLTNYLVLLFSLSVHESAHAWTALKLGDDTAASLGRITLNPIPHIDLFGTILLPLIALIAGAPLLGWAKPTPYEPSRFRRDVSLRRGHISVAAAGPVSNGMLVILFTIALAVVLNAGLPADMSSGLKNILSVAIILNVTLALFNMLPVPPLDGSHVVSWSLPRAIGEKFDEFAESYGNILLWILFLTGALSYVLAPPTNLILHAIDGVLARI